MRLLALTPSGDAAGEERTVVDGGSIGSQLPPDAVEVAATAAAGRMAVAYVHRDQTQLSIRAVYGDDRGEAFSDPIDLGGTLMSRVGRRGQLDVAASQDGTLEIFYRGETGPCALGGRNDCPQLHVQRIGSEPTRRRGLPLAVPEPCDPAVVGFANAGDVWYYGLCAVEEGVSAARVFAIQFEPQYAHHEKLLEGCTPSGLVPFNDGVLITARCEEQLRGVLLQHAGRSVRTVEGAPRAQCAGGNVALEIGGAREVLRGARGRLESILPRAVAPRGSRAVWTGESVIVAAPIGREVALRRYECEEGAFLRTDHE